MKRANALPNRLQLPQVTLCAVSSVNVSATIRALEVSLEKVDFANCILFTDALVRVNDHRINVIPIVRLTSSQAYSDFVLSHVVEHIDTSHCLIAQWDGHVLDAERWRSEFLDYDYIGASWPQFLDGHDVGNGGFSLRSRRLMELCREPGFKRLHPEDVAIGRYNRQWLEGKGIRFAPGPIADLFSAERAGDVSASFGYHGAWHMPQVIGANAFWAIYRQLDERGTIRHDFGSIIKQLWAGQGGWQRALRLILDQNFLWRRFAGRFAYLPGRDRRS